MLIAHSRCSPAAETATAVEPEVKATLGTTAARKRQQAAAVHDNGGGGEVQLEPKPDGGGRIYS